MSEKEIKSLHTQTRFILDNLRTENASCKGCKEESIKYYVSLLNVIDFVIEQRLWNIIK